MRGARETVRGAVRLARREAEGAVRRRRLARRPLALAAGELDATLGGDPVELLRTRVLAALPSVAAFERSVDASVLARAADVLAHRFDLLGSGPVQLDRIDWQLDVKSGRRWPLVHISRVPVSYSDGSDIKWPWELSRCQHLPLLAAAWRETNDRRYLDELGAQLDSWIDGNPVELGANWLIAMEPAIRAVNWIAALAIVAEDAAAEPWFRRALESLVLHGRFIRSHLEGGPVRGNHYLSDIVGLLALGALFAGPEGTRWLQHGARSLAVELDHQVLPDGVDHEVSTAYHRFVTELFVCGLQVVEALAPAELPPRHRERVDQMLRFTRDVTRPDGLVPLVGDSDDGRLLPLADYGADPRAARAGPARSRRDRGRLPRRRLLRPAPRRCVPSRPLRADRRSRARVARPQRPAVVRARAGQDAARRRPRLVRLHRRSSRAESLPLDLLSLDGLDRRRRAERPLAVRALPAGRPDERLAAPSGRRRSSRAATPAFPSLGGVSHTRRLELGDHELLIEDTIEGAAGKALTWAFPLAGGAAAVTATGVEATVDEVTLAVHRAVDWRVEEGWYAPRYGVRVAVPFVRARKTATSARDTTALRISF